MNTKILVPWLIIIAIIIGCLFIIINTVRYVTNASYSTSAYINLSDWVHRLAEIRLDDIHAAGIREVDLPITISAAQMQVIYRNRASDQDVMPIPLMPHLEDPWGYPLQFNLLSLSPTMHWRVTSRVGKTFFGAWIFGIREIPWKGPMKYEEEQPGRAD